MLALGTVGEDLILTSNPGTDSFVIGPIFFDPFIESRNGDRASFRQFR
jgi:hypothetical protein